MKIISYHLTGNANVKAAILGLYEAKLLKEFHVTIATFPGGILDHFGAIKPFSEFRRRSFDIQLKPFIKTWPWLEIGRVISPKIGLSQLSYSKRGPFHIDILVQRQDRRIASRLKFVAEQGVSAIYGYEDCSLFSFREAKKLGLRCFYDLPIGYWRTAHRLLAMEREIKPEWASTITGLFDSKEKLARKDEELILADRIFVASSFTANTLKDFPGSLAPIEVIPYGFPEINTTKRYYPSHRKGKPIKLLFVGSLSQRKGIANLFEAVKAFKQHVTLTIVGNKTGSVCPALDVALAQHLWYPSLSHDLVLKLMREHDILVFPSLFEGFGLVITEAMSQGTPVITTERTIGPDIIRDGLNGWLIQAGSTDALQSAIEQLLYKPTLIAKAGYEAVETARSRPWKVYSQELAIAMERSI